MVILEKFLVLVGQCPVTESSATLMSSEFIVRQSKFLANAKSEASTAMFFNHHVSLYTVGCLSVGNAVALELVTSRQVK